MKHKFEYRGYTATLTGELGMCWDLYAHCHDPKGESFLIPGLGMDYETMDELILEAKETMDENIYEDDEEDNDNDL
ncbi:MAG: hypothetical protein AB1861_06245 [Cyanobacteriota bacterium]